MLSKKHGLVIANDKSASFMLCKVPLIPSMREEVGNERKSYTFLPPSCAFAHGIETTKNDMINNFFKILLQNKTRNLD